MDALLNKLNFKTPKSVLIVNAPDEVKPMVDSIKQYAEVSVTVGDNDPVDFVICFVTRKAEIAPLVNLIIPKLNEDAVFWICYPKGSSKRYKCDFNRDNGWEALGKFEMEPVRQVAIDDDWSALRFRSVGFIKSLKREASWVLSSEGKKRISIQKE